MAKLNEELKEEKVEDKEKVLVDKITLDNILLRLNELENTTTPAKKVKRIGNLTAKIRYIDGKIVAGYGKTWDKVDVGGRRYMMVEVIDIDGAKHETEYLKFIESGEFVEGEIVSVDKTEEEERLGSTLLAKVDYDNFKTEVTDKEVPMVVVKVTHTYKIKLPDGNVIDLPEEALN